MSDRLQSTDPAIYYQGEIAATYESRRSAKETWRREEELVGRMLEVLGFGPGSIVLDAPVGTGRLLPLFESLGCDVVGLDVSSDMLEIAERRARELSFKSVVLFRGNLAMTGLPNDSVDIAICMRFAHLVDVASLGVAMSELARVSRGGVLVTVPLWNPILGSGIWEGSLRLLARTRYGLRGPHHRRRKRTLIHSESAVLDELQRRGFDIRGRQVVKGSHLKTYWMIHLVQ